MPDLAHRVRADAAPLGATRYPWLRRLAPPLLSMLLLGLALWALHRLAHEVSYHQVRGYLHQLGSGQIALAVLMTATGYAVMTLYDLSALRAIGQRLPYARVSMVSFISYAFTNSIGMGMLVSSSIRYRFYIQAGLTPGDVARVVVYCGTGFWLGLCTLTGVSLVALPLPATLPLAAFGRPLGALLLCFPLFWLCAHRLHRPLRIGRWQLDWPTAALAARQIVIGSLDWALAAGVLYVLMPAPIAGNFGHFLVIFVLAQLSGLLSHVPGGLGVFEAVILAGLGASGHQALMAPILGALAAFRVIYYLLPLVAASVVVLWHETRQMRRAHDAADWFSGMLPPVFAGLTLVAGAVLLFSGATHALPERMQVLRGFVPVPVLEISHFLGSVIGMMLLILARGLQRRLDAAWGLTLVLLLAGAAFSLLKGLDYEEAGLLLLLALALAPARRQFSRHASLFSTSFSWPWVSAIVTVLACAAWLLVFSYHHGEYRQDLWWQISFSHGAAPRAVRALVGASVVGLLFATARLIRATQPKPGLPDEAELARAWPLIKQSCSSNAHLALMADKSLLFGSNDTAFIMYAIAGRSWVALGDPVGQDRQARQELIWTFRERCEQAGGWPVFYQVRGDDLNLYLDAGMRLYKIGEEARVRLETFDLGGKGHKSLRNGINKLLRDGLRMEIVAAESVPALLPRLKPISDAWLADKRVREKGFSLGTFEPAYLARMPMAVVWRGGQPLAFANLFLPANRAEASLDLMRHRPDGPNGLMDFLIVQLLLWARQQGYRYFNLGMAPLSGLHNRPLEPLWNRFGALVYGRGEHFYNFRGLHDYKDKFDPEWESRHLAVPAGIALPMILTDITALISGGLAGVARR